MKNKFLLTIVLVISVFAISACTEQAPASTSKQKATTTKKAAFKPEPVVFSGIKGESVSIVNDVVSVEKKVIDDGKAHYYNTELDGETIYFFVVKDKNGIYRAAGNACQVCASSKMGFVQEGNNMVCNTCGNAYPLEKIATEKGGCNPVPINPNLTAKNGKIIIEKTDLQELKGFF